MRRRCGFAATLLAGALVVLAATSLDAQEARVNISGKVTDPSGTLLAGVSVTLLAPSAEGASHNTDENGEYRFVDLPPGSYDLSFSLVGFAPETRNLRLLAGASVVENAVLPALKQSTVAMVVDAEATDSEAVGPTNSATNVLKNLARVSTSTPEGNPGNESAVEETAVTAQADLVVTSRDSVDPVIAGTALTYTVTVKNNGPSHARLVEVTDTLPAEMTLDSTSGCAEDPRGVPLCSLGTLAAGGEKQFTVTATVDSGANGTIDNQVSVGSQTREIQSGDESAVESTRIDTSTDLEITTSDSTDPVIAGDVLIYTVRVTNNGPSDARDVVVRDDLLSAGATASTDGC